MGPTIQRMLAAVAAGMLFASAAWAETVEIPEPPGVLPIEDPAYDAPGDAGSAACWDVGCTARYHNVEAVGKFLFDKM